MPSYCNSVSCFKQKTYNLPLKFRYFHFSVSSRTLTASWLPIFVSAKLSRTILSIDRSEPRFERHAGTKITKILKNDGNFNGFC